MRPTYIHLNYSHILVFLYLTFGLNKSNVVVTELEAESSLSADAPTTVQIVAIHLKTSKNFLHLYHLRFIF